MPIYRHLKKEKSKRNICSLNSSSKHGWKKWRMKEGDSFPLVADKATWVWTPTNNAFLNGDPHETVFMAQPEGCVDASRHDHVFQLHKALHALRQTPRAWFEHLKTTILQ